MVFNVFMIVSLVSVLGEHAGLTGNSVQKGRHALNVVLPAGGRSSAKNLLDLPVAGSAIDAQSEQERLR
jgi:hypothetical protein